VPFTFAILGTILFYTWVLEPRGVPVMVPAAVVVGATLVSAWRSREWGLSPKALLPATRSAAMFTVPAVFILLGAGFALGTLHDRRAFLENLAALVPWGVAQQWVLQTVVFREVRRLTPKISILIAALLFSLVHVPNVFLMAMTFIGALGWCAIYARHPNILPLGLSHAVATLAILYAFDDEITGRLRIGRAFSR
jgi:membrane protease YdiL (CAAX protease family)